MTAEMAFLSTQLPRRPPPRLGAQTGLRTIEPYIGFSRTEFRFCCLWTRVVSQGVVCLHSVGFGGSWTFMVIFFNVSRGSTLFVSLYIICLDGT
jgi:hypothetical protein